MAPRKTNIFYLKMKTIRTNCFETNSSSTHSITIDNQSFPKIEDVKNKDITCGEFGWEFDNWNSFSEKCSYFWTLAQSDYADGAKDLKARLQRLAKKHSFNLIEPNEKNYYYVDHGWEHYDDFVDQYPKLLTDEGLFKFLVNKKNIIHGGNDNC